MHHTAHEIARDAFASYWREGWNCIVELGAQDVNGALRDHQPTGSLYCGLDQSPGKGVDVVVDPAHPLPLADGCADAVLASSVLEHDPAFWASFAELCRIARPGGFIYVNAPSNGHVHRYPLDCWRFYPDAGQALAAWACRAGWPVVLMESFIARFSPDGSWHDFVAVFRRGEDATPPAQWLGPRWAALEWRHAGQTEPPAHVTEVPDQERWRGLQAELAASQAANAALREELRALREQAGQLVARLGQLLPPPAGAAAPDATSDGPG